MKTLILSLMLVSFISIQAHSWGSVGHRAVGEVANKHLTLKAKTQLKVALGGQDLSDIANWPDHIKSYSKYRSYGPWHYTTVADGEKYKVPSNHNDGSVVQRIKNLELVLVGQGDKDIFTYKQNLAWYVHLVGDLHQPLHVGRQGTRGGNSVIVKWHNRRTRLHAVWDGSMITDSKLSYKELAQSAMRLAKNKKWATNGDVEDWTNESVELRQYAYDLVTSRLDELNQPPAPLEPISSITEIIQTRTYKPKNNVLPNLGYSYQARNFEVVQQRIYQAGVRLANALNKIFEKKGLKRVKN